jgi:hypothetical protein
VTAFLFWPRTILDYRSGTSGQVLDTNGMPIAGASVTIHFEETVFEAITPTRAAAMTTTADGRFAVHFLSCGRPGGDHRVVVKKPGYETAVARGSGIGTHRISLRILVNEQRPRGRAADNDSRGAVGVRCSVASSLRFRPIRPGLYNSRTEP